MTAWVQGCVHETFSDRGRYFCFRRDGVTGRMATLIWMEERRG